MIEITVPGEPVAKGRHQCTRTGRPYTPAKTVAYEKKVAALAKIAMRGRPPTAEPVVATVICFFTIPKSGTKTFKAAALADKVRPTKAPDLSNVVKAIEDGMNKIVYLDDSQIVETRTAKLWGRFPCVRVIIEPWCAP